MGRKTSYRPHADAEDSDLCRAIRASDATAFEAVFRTKRTKLLAYVASITRDTERAHDLVQDVFADLWQSRESLDPEKSLEALLYRMCRNRSLTTRRNETTRRNKRIEIRESRSGVHNNGVEDALDSRELDRKLQTWLDELPERQRESLMLSRLHGMNHREIAVVMDVSPRTVNNHISRALDTLRQRLRSVEPSLPDE